jgi:putative endonuclease
MASTSRQATGRLGENLAADYLVQQGYRILGRNIRTSYGEIDLLALQNASMSSGNPGGKTEALVFVEVKTRRSKGFGLPEESITALKRSHMLAAAQAYLQDHPDQDGDWRLDVIAIRMSGPDDTNTEIVHFENIIP